MSPHFPGFRVLSSKPLEIKSSEKTYFIHADILASQPESLSHTATGELAETIDLSSWDSDTVGLFTEFLYTGDYALESILQGDGGRQDGSYTPDSVQSLADQGQLNILLVHAKVYALAQHKDIEVLRMMAFERLKAALEAIDRRMLGGISRVTTNVVELLGYVYQHTSPDEPMRELVSKFVVENVEKLMGRGEVALLLRDGGDFAAELMEGVAGRVCDAERLCELEKEVEDWKNQVAVSAEKIRHLEATNAAKIQELETTNAEKVKELEATNAAKIQELETTNAEKVKGLEAANAAKIQELETTNVEKVKGLEATNAAKIQELEATNAEKVKELEAKNAARVQELEAINVEKVKELKAANEKAKELETANAEKVKELEAAKAEVQGLSNKVEELTKAANPVAT